MDVPVVGGALLHGSMGSAPLQESSPRRKLVQFSPVLRGFPAYTPCPQMSHTTMYTLLVDSKASPLVLYGHQSLLTGALLLDEAGLKCCPWHSVHSLFVS